MNQGLCGIFCPPLLKGRPAGVHKSSKVFIARERAAGPPEGGLEGSDKAGGRHAWARMAVSVRRDLLSAWPVAGDSDNPVVL
jgi:hypothetical protein